MLSGPPDEVFLTRIIRGALQEAADKLREKFIKDAVTSYENELRRVVAGAAIDVTKLFELSRNGPDLVIKIKDYR